MLRFRARCAFLSLLLSLQFHGDAANYTINTIAGHPDFGAGGPAVNARFGIVSAVAMGPDGSVYVADAAYHQVFKVGTDGRISVLAGCQIRGFSGDFGPATAATLDTPTALAVDSGGDVFIADSGNHRVREVTIYGNIQTVAGNGQVAPNPQLSPILPGEGGPATSAPLNQIAGLAFASNDDLVIADIGNNRIFRVSHDGNIHTIAGNATSPASLADQPALSATLKAPTGVAADWYGNIFFAEQVTGVVRQIDLNGQLTRIIGTGSPADTPVAGGPPMAYPLFSPMALTSDGRYLYIADTGRVSMYTLPIGRPASIQTIAGDITQHSGWAGDGGSALAAGMHPMSLAVSRNTGAIYLADSVPTLDFHNRVRMVAGSVVTPFAGGNLPTGDGDNGPAISAQLYFPRALAIDAAGNVTIADTFDNRVRVVTKDGKISTVAGTGTAGTSGDGGPGTAANLNAPQGLALDDSGSLYIADGMDVRAVNTSGVINTVAVIGSPVSGNGMSSVAVDTQNNVYLAASGQVREIAAASGLISTIVGMGAPGYSGDNGPAILAAIGNVAAVALDANGNLYIADGDNNRIRKVNPAGNITTFAGGGTSMVDGAKATDAVLNYPIAVATDASGNVYIAEYGGNRIRVVTTDGAINTIAGNGRDGFSGDGGLATNASLDGPTDVKVDAQGNVYIADSLNSAVRKLTPRLTPVTPTVMTVTNSASLSSGPVAPGERLLLMGSALGPNSQVFFGNVAAPIIESSFSTTQVVVPYEIAGQANLPITVVTEDVTSTPFPVQVATAAPGIFTVGGTGQGQAVAFGQNGLPNSPANSIPGGSIISVLCTGAGLISPSVATGVPVPVTTPSPVLPVSAMLGGVRAVVDQAYSIPGTVGQFMVDIRVPDGIAQDDQASVVVMVGDVMTSPGPTLAIREQQDSSSSVDAQPSLIWYHIGHHKRSLPVRAPK